MIIPRKPVSRDAQIQPTLPPRSVPASCRRHRQLLHVEKPLQSDTTSGPSASVGGVTTRKITGVAWFVVNVALLSATFLYALDNTVTATVRPGIVETFGHRIDMLPWVSVAYPMGEFGANPIW